MIIKVIAINEYKNDWPVGVAVIPPGKTADEVFVEWVRQHSSWASEPNNQKILDECLYVCSEVFELKINVEEATNEVGN